MIGKKCLKCGKVFMTVNYNRNWDLGEVPTIGLDGTTNFCSCKKPKFKKEIKVKFTKAETIYKRVIRPTGFKPNIKKPKTLPFVKLEQ